MKLKGLGPGFGVIKMEIINNLITSIDGLPAWVAALTALVTAATGITALTPTKADNKVLDVVLKILNVAAGNVAKNKNADDK